MYAAKCGCSIGFSALQRAENSSISLSRVAIKRDRQKFQCSSASRKFLNQPDARLNLAAHRVSVLFSEPKIPQAATRRASTQCRTVSVLFSEPKIPQPVKVDDVEMKRIRFQCSSASRKFLNLPLGSNPPHCREFQCSSASRKFLKPHRSDRNNRVLRFSALQRAENSSTRPSHLRPSIFPTATITLRRS